MYTRSLSICSSTSSFYLTGDHRALHSFPTRRSSDLGLQRLALDVLHRDVEKALDLVGIVDGHDVRMIQRDHLRCRSEEHTSELQSRRDLVCRLLLEKKKPTWYRDLPFRPWPPLVPR